MRLLFVTESLGSGGAERQLTGLASILARGGHECTVVTWVDKNFHANTLAESGVEHILLHPKGRIDRVIKLASIYKKSRPDAVIAFLPMANETALLASMLCPAKVIVSERSFTVDWGLRRKLTSLLYRRAFRIVANSYNETHNLKEHIPTLADKILAIPNYVDCSMFHPRVECHSKNGVLRLVGVGRVIPSKNILRLIEALAELRKRGFAFNFKWYGATYDSEYLRQVQDATSALDLQECFELMGECHDMPAAYAEADAFVMPSLHEGYPNVLVEAMASELTVGASALCEHPYIVKENVNGFLFDPTNIHEIVYAIEKLLTLTPAQRLEMGRRNREKVLANNSIESFKQKYLAIL
ncbi:MAG: glycosyltransferase family 4 protein [Muribaculum sp.]|nr:glycosyltransferase family 4 protein [Muribaculum sp.]